MRQHSDKKKEHEKDVLCARARTPDVQAQLSQVRINLVYLGVYPGEGLRLQDLAAERVQRTVRRRLDALLGRRTGGGSRVEVATCTAGFYLFA
jgi:hypothetical protein